MRSHQVTAPNIYPYTPPLRAPNNVVTGVTQWFYPAKYRWTLPRPHPHPTQLFAGLDVCGRGGVGHNYIKMIPGIPGSITVKRLGCAWMPMVLFWEQASPHLKLWLASLAWYGARFARTMKKRTAGLQMTVLLVSR